MAQRGSPQVPARVISAADWAQAVPRVAPWARLVKSRLCVPTIVRPVPESAPPPESEIGRVPRVFFFLAPPYEFLLHIPTLGGMVPY